MPRRQAPAAPSQERERAQPRRRLPPTPSVPHSEDGANTQGGGGNISVDKLIRWLVNVIPILLSSQEKSPSEILAGLMTSLLSLLQDG